jgi:large subunit ribosomal protein L20
MTRVKRGLSTHKRHKRLLKHTKGFWGQRKNIFKRAHETLMRAWAFAFAGRKLRKRDMRSLFITRVGAAAQQYGMPYNVFISSLKKADVQLNRKMLSQIAIFDTQTFEQLIAIARG